MDSPIFIVSTVTFDNVYWSLRCTNIHIAHVSEVFLIRRTSTAQIEIASLFRVEAGEHGDEERSENVVFVTSLMAFESLTCAFHAEPDD